MKKNEIKKGGKYRAKISGNLVTVRVDEIREVGKSRYNAYSGKMEYTDAVVYDITNLKTGRKTTFRSAAKFRAEVTSELEAKISRFEQRLTELRQQRAAEAVEQILGEELANGVTPMPEALSQKI